MTVLSVPDTARSFTSVGWVGLVSRGPATQSPVSCLPPMAVAMTPDPRSRGRSIDTLLFIHLEVCRHPPTTSKARWFRASDSVDLVFQYFLHASSILNENVRAHALSGNAWQSRWSGSEPQTDRQTDWNKKLMETREVAMYPST